MATDDDERSERPTTPRPHDAAVTREVSDPAAERGHPYVPEPDRYLGTTLAGRYKILEKLGQGGMGVVYLAEHVLIEKKVAVKVLVGDFAQRRDLVQRFAREAKAASKIGHENIINITDFGETPSGSAFFAMEHLEGRDLGRLLRAEGALAIPRVVRIIGQVCRALGAAHAKGIVHRDLKPDNVFLVERDGRRDFVKVLDFGLAKVSVLHEGSRLTRTGMIFGTAEYMSPEQARGDAADHRADVYSTGCLLYEMLTGDVPFRATSFMGIVRKQIEEQPEPPSERAPERQIGLALDAVVLKALVKDRDARFQSMKELALALCAATNEDARLIWGVDDVQTPTVVPPPRGSVSVTPSEVPRSRQGALLVGGAAVLVAGAIAIWAATSGRPAAQQAGAQNLVTQKIAPQNIGTQNNAATNVPAQNVAAQNVAARAGTSRVVVLSTPPDAEVVNGPERLGRTPLTLTLPRDAAPFDVTVHHGGYRDQRLRLEPDRDREYTVRLLLAPARAPHPAPPAAAAAPAARPTTATPPTPPAPDRKTPRELKDVE
jgi:serine/threonine-protein kinase